MLSRKEKEHGVPFPATLTRAQQNSASFLVIAGIAGLMSAISNNKHRLVRGENLCPPSLAMTFPQHL